MSGTMFWRAMGLMTATALAGCGAAENALRNAPLPLQEKLTLQSAMSTEFLNEAPAVVHFAFDSDELDADARKIVAAQAAWILDHPNVKFSVTGHTDRVGSNAYNMDLGLRRASRVVAALVAAGVKENQLIAQVTQGEEINIIATEDRERANRRTVTEVIGFLATARTASAGRRSHDRDASDERTTMVYIDDEDEIGPQDESGDPEIIIETNDSNDDGNDDGDDGNDDGNDDGSDDGDDGNDDGSDDGNDDGSNDGNDDESETDAGPGNPGNGKNVGNAGETPKPNHEWGSGEHGRAH